ncbi:hypothetical protein MMPV_002860 [Pyropia vietnamensis]
MAPMLSRPPSALRRWATTFVPAAVPVAALAAAASTARHVSSTTRGPVGSPSLRVDGLRTRLPTFTYGNCRQRLSSSSSSSSSLLSVPPVMTAGAPRRLEGEGGLGICGVLPSLDASLASDGGDGEPAYRSVLFLRGTAEAGPTAADRAAQAAAAGMGFEAVPLAPASADAATATAVVAALDRLPPPVLIECASGTRAGAVASLWRGRREGLTADAVVARAEASGLGWVNVPPLKAWVTANV